MLDRLTVGAHSAAVGRYALTHGLELWDGLQMRTKYSNYKCTCIGCGGTTLPQAHFNTLQSYLLASGWPQLTCRVIPL